MILQPSRIFISRILSLDIFDPLGDRLGRLRDVVVHYQHNLKFKKSKTFNNLYVVGIVIEVLGKKRVFVPMTRLISIDSNQLICTGLVNLRRFVKRGAEILVIGEMFDQKVLLVDKNTEAIIQDVAMDKKKLGEWLISQLFVKRIKYLSSGLKRFRKNETLIVDWKDIAYCMHEKHQGAKQFIAIYENSNPADFAEAMQDISRKRRFEIIRELQDKKLADVLQELPNENQIDILLSLNQERAATVLEEMDPDDATDILQKLPNKKANELLALMEPEEAKEVQRLLEYDENSAGGLMTSAPIILPPEATVAEGLAHVAREDLSPLLTINIFICRPPLETPTGIFLGMINIQKLLRYPPPELLGNLVNKTTSEAVLDIANINEVAKMLATYNLSSLPIINESNRLVGAVTVDDILDRVLHYD